MGKEDLIVELQRTCRDPRANEVPQEVFPLFFKKWNMSVIFVLFQSESLRFGELKKRIPGITNTMLSSSLRVLERKNILHRAQYSETPPRTEYSLTPQGRALLPVFYEIMRWGLQYALE